MEGIGLAHLYPAYERGAYALAIMDIRAHPISFASRPWKAVSATGSPPRSCLA
jgi:hypothetical protein